MSPRSVVHRAIMGVLLIACAGGARASCGDVAMPAAAAHAAIDFVQARVVSAHIGSIGGVPAPVRTQLKSAREMAGRDPLQRELADALNGLLVPHGDAHLEVRMQDSAVAGCDALPIGMAWNSSGLWVRSGAGPVPTGSRIDAIGELSDSDLEQRLATRLPHETRQWLLFHAAQLLAREDTLRVLGLVDREGKVALRILTPDGKQQRASIALQSSPDSSQRPWFGWRLHPEAGTGVFWFGRFEYNAQIAGAFAEFLRRAGAADIRKVAIDIRGNPGGDSSVAVAMLDAMTAGDYSSFSVEVRPSPELAAQVPVLMPESLNPVLQQAGLPAIPADAATYLLPSPLVLAQLRGRTEVAPIGARLDGRRLFLLTDGGTFSSGTLFAALVRDNRLGEIVGESPGNTAGFNGSELRFDIPGMDYYLNLSTARMHRPDGNASNTSSIEPDIQVVPRGGDFAAGRDPALDAVLQK
jgi:Peptidase family S41